MGRSKNPQGRKQEIIEAGSRLFLQRGYQAVSMMDVAAEIGVVKGALYRYFASKRELFDACIYRMVDVQIKNISTEIEDSSLPVENRLFAYLQLHRKMTERMGIHMERNGKLDSQTRVLIYVQSEEYLAESLARLIEEGCANGVFLPCSPRETAHFILFGMFGLRSTCETHEQVREHFCMYVARMLGVDLSHLLEQ